MTASYLGTLTVTFRDSQPATFDWDSGTSYPTLDQRPVDRAPDRCWRCDASPAFDDIGLCPPCRTSLSGGAP